MPIIFGSSSIIVSGDWAKIKGIVASKNLELQYEEDASRYTIFVCDDLITYVTYIYKTQVPEGPGFDDAQNTTDRNDFVANFQPIANLPTHWGSGKTPTGTTPPEAPTSVSGVDRAGNKQHVTVLPTYASHKGFIFTTAQTDNVIWTPAAGKRIYVTGYQFMASGNQDVNSCAIFFGTNVAANWIFVSKLDLAVNSPIVMPMHIAPPVRGEINESLKITFSDAASIGGVIFGYEDV